MLCVSQAAPLTPQLRLDSGRDSSAVAFSPAGASYPDDEFLSHVKARCERFPSSVCGSAVRQAALLTWQVEVG